MTIFSTVSRAHLRRAGPDGLAVSNEDGREQSRERAARVTRRRRLRFTRGTRRYGAAASLAPFRAAGPTGAAAAAHGTPGDRPPAVPAVSRCRARQHHGQAVTLAPDAPIAERMSQRPGRNAAHCPGRSLQPQRCSASRYAGRAYGAPLTLEPLPTQRA